MDKSSTGKSWLFRVLRKWIWLVGLLPLVIDLFVTYIPLSSLPKGMQDVFQQEIRWEISIVMLSLGLFASAYLVHRDTQAELAHLHAEQAYLKLHPLSFAFLHEDHVRIFDKTYQFGIDADGLPVKAIAAASIEVHNIGREEGELEWELDLERSDMPPIFQLLEDEVNGEMHDLPKRIPARKRINAMWRIGCGASLNDPKEFARQLGQNQSFNLLLRYRTIRLVEPSEYSEIRVTGSINGYRELIRKRWVALGHKELATILEDEGSA